MKLYHGSSSEITRIEDNAMYFTPDIEEARELALRLDDCGNHEHESFIYTIEIDEHNVAIENDFLLFDGIGYQLEEDDPDVIHNPETGWYCIRNPKINFEEHCINQL